MLKPSNKDDSEGSHGTKDSKDKSKINSKENADKGEKSKSQTVDVEKAESPENYPSDPQLVGKDQIKQDVVSEPLDDTSDGNATEKSTDSLLDEEDVYYIDDVVNKSGFGKFQHLISFLSGLGSFTDAFEAVILSILGDFMACDWTIRRWQNALLTSVVFLGITLGGPVFGAIADVYGRRIAIFSSLFAVLAFGAGSALSQNFVTMLVVRGLTGLAIGGVTQGGTMCIEYYPAVYRGVGGFYLSYYWAIGTIVVILVNWGIMEALDSWRWFLFAASLPALFICLVIKWYPESARYYLVSHQPKKAVKQLERLARMNKIEMPKGHLVLPGEDEALGRILDLLRPDHRVSTFLMWYIWFAVAFVYYGYALMAPIIITNGKLRVSKEELTETFNINATSDFLDAVISCKKLTRHNYIDLLWTTAAEFPGLVVFTFLVKILNRKVLLSGSCFFTTLITFLLLVDTNYRVVPNILLFFGRAILIAIYQLALIITLETFPTTLRAVALGTGAGLAGLGGAVVPFTAQVLLISYPIVAVCIIGIVIFLAAVSAVLLPREMKDTNLKELTDDYVASPNSVQK